MISLVIDFSSKESKERLWKILKTVKERKYSIELKQYRETRSLNQNNYYWGAVLHELSRHTGYTDKEMHMVLAEEFLSYYKVLPNGKETKLVKSTTELDTKEFEEYLEKIKIWAIQELDCLIKDPNEHLNN